MKTPPPPLTSVRLDKWLWAVRLFKTRSLATDACRHHRVEVGGQEAKPSREVKIGEKIRVKEEFLTREYEITGLVEKRVGPKLVADLRSELTDPALIAQAQAQRQEHRLGTPAFVPGMGRPTKAQRREIDAFYQAEDRVRAWSPDDDEAAEDEA
jgi:ribosome-associated heat shock protein Hsp15